jgi:transcription antitermination factor NusG
MERKWYAVYTRPKYEKKLISSLVRKRIECFCPMNRIMKTGSFDRKKLISEPLFPNYVFVKIAEQEMLLIRQCSEVINFIYWLGRPVVIKDVEIQNILEFSNNYINIVLEKTPVSVNKMVRIVNRLPFDPNEENVYHMNSTYVKVTLPSLGYNICALSNEIEISEEETRSDVKNLVS